MASKEFVCIDMGTLPVTVTTSTPVYIGDLDPSTVVFEGKGTFDATYQVYVSVDGTNYFVVGAAMADAGAQVVMSTDSTAKAKGAVWAYVGCTEYTSGTATVCVTGLPKAGLSRNY